VQHTKNFRATLIASLALAAMAFAAPWLMSFNASEMLALLWVALALLALFSFKKRGLWFLVGAPLALYWPTVIVVLCRDFLRAFC
jgi:hypothetical protein